MSDDTDPKAKAQLRVALRERRSYLIEQNALDADEAANFDKIRELAKSLPRRERMEMERRTRERLAELNEILDGERKQFDHPKVQHEDLVDGVRILNFYE